MKTVLHFLKGNTNACPYMHAYLQIYIKIICTCIQVNIHTCIYTHTFMLTKKYIYICLQTYNISAFLELPYLYLYKYIYTYFWDRRNHPQTFVMVPGRLGPFPGPSWSREGSCISSIICQAPGRAEVGSCPSSTLCEEPA